MNSTLKVFGLLIVFFTLTLIGLLIGINVHAQELSMEEATEVELIKLRASDIIFSQEKTIGIYDGRLQIGTEDVIDYAYKENEIDGSNVIFDNSNYSSVEKIDKNLYRVYSEIKFFRNENGQIQEIIHKRVSKDLWEQSKLQTTAEKISTLLKTPYCLADTYYPSSDGYTGNTSQSSYANARNSTPSGVNSDAQAYVESHQHETGLYSITRGYFHFDTSAIPDDYLIGSASLFLYGYNGKAGTENYNVYTSTSTSLTTGSWWQIDDTALSTNISATDFNVAGYNEYELNAIGTSTISKTGTTAFVVRQVEFDVNNASPSANAYRLIAVETSANAGTDKDPYLIVELIEPEEEEPENPTASSTADLYPCSIPSNTRIDWITGCKNIYGSSTASTTLTAIEYYYYQIPLAIWIVFGTCFIYLFSRLRLEYLMRFRK